MSRFEPGCAHARAAERRCADVVRHLLARGECLGERDVVERAGLGFAGADRVDTGRRRSTVGVSSGGNGWPGDRNLDRARIGHVEAGSVRGAALDLQAVEARGLDGRAEVVVGARNRFAPRRLDAIADGGALARRTPVPRASTGPPAAVPRRRPTGSWAAATDPAPAPPAGSAARSCSRRPERSRQHRSLPRRSRRRRPNLASTSTSRRIRRTRRGHRWRAPWR